jgi:hypothetical protein
MYSFEYHASPNRAKVPRPEIYLHKVDLFRVLELHSHGSWNFLESWVLSSGSFFENHASPNRAKVPRLEIYLHKVMYSFENHASPNRAKVPRPEIYLHKVDLFRVLELHSDESWNFLESWVLSSGSFFENHASPNRAKVPRLEIYLHKVMYSFENHASPNRAKVPRPEIYLHKVDFFRVLELHSDGSWYFLNPGS